MSDFIKRGSAVADDIVTRLRNTYYEYEDAELAFDAADEIERLRDAGDALADLVRRRLPHHGWTTADREVASVVLDAWEEARRG